MAIATYTITTGDRAAQLRILLVSLIGSIATTWVAAALRLRL